MRPVETRELRQLRDHNARLNRLVAALRFMFVPSEVFKHMDFVAEETLSIVVSTAPIWH